MSTADEPAAAPAIEMPFTEQQMRAWGYLAWRALADGSVMAVAPMLFGNGRLYLDVHAAGYGDAYCYESVDRAVEGMRAFDPSTQSEPDGWKRHPYTGRRRPGGDAAHEHVIR